MDVGGGEDSYKYRSTALERSVNWMYIVTFGNTLPKCYFCL